MLLRIPSLTYAAMVPFGFSQLVAYKKLLIIAKSKAPADNVESMMGFILAASSALVALSECLAGKLFDAFPDQMPFIVVNSALAVLALAQWRLRSSLRRQTLKRE